MPKRKRIPAAEPVDPEYPWRDIWQLDEIKKRPLPKEKRPRWRMKARRTDEQVAEADG